ncbi:hypothetical protein [Nereida sp. MMG025]|uniref:hypothetical protein n=1 Tax=Nereida sp. MMG025 TaxID=2909981 RepID=UPI001F208DA1|nr:hypothetical protein [Nereida sp. MMG025]MCF6443917.1 hypothetical protein [Nereida sp. MMG025]
MHLLGKKPVLLIPVLLALAACGETDLERGVTGAAAGAVTAKAVDGDVLLGTAIGAAAGVLSDDLGLN